MFKIIFVVILGYLILVASQMIEALIIKKMGKENMTAGNTFIISIIGYLIFIIGFIILLQTICF